MLTHSSLIVTIKQNRPYKNLSSNGTKQQATFYWFGRRSLKVNIQILISTETNHLDRIIGNLKRKKFQIWVNKYICKMHMGKYLRINVKCNYTITKLNSLMKLISTRSSSGRMTEFSETSLILTLQWGFTLILNN